MISANDISKAADLLLAGELVAFPTETVYGLGALATDDKAVARIYAAKGRPQFNPLIAHVEDVEAAFAQGEFSADALKLAARFWPGPLTLVVPRWSSCTVSLLASAGLPSLALRVPQHVRDGLGNKVAMILDGGPSAVGVESTVVGFLGGRATLLRPGGLSREMIEEALGYPLLISPGGEMHSPGQMESHYAPQASLRLNAESAMAGEIYLGFGRYSSPHNLSPSGDVIEAAANLFLMLHELDRAKPTRIAVAPIPNIGLGEAINDRLKRAAAPR
jgi:L-threonylcarbamoyladenylate synthase